MPRLHIFNKNIIMSSFKSSGDIQKKEGGLKFLEHKTNNQNIHNFGE